MGETTQQATYSRRADVLSAELGDGEAVLLGETRETYFGLNGPGARIWALLETPKTLDEICGVLVTEFDVELNDCRNDTREILAEFVSNGLAGRET